MEPKSIYRLKFLWNCIKLNDAVIPVEYCQFKNRLWIHVKGDEMSQYGIRMLAFLFGDFTVASTEIPSGFVTNSVWVSIEHPLYPFVETAYNKYLIHDCKQDLKREIGFLRQWYGEDHLMEKATMTKRLEELQSRKGYGQPDLVLANTIFKKMRKILEEQKKRMEGEIRQELEKRRETIDMFSNI